MKRSAHLKRIYSEIVQGVSLVKINSLPFYIKHPSSVESSEMESLYEVFLDEAIDADIPTEEEKEKYLISVGLWSAQNNIEIAKWKEFLKTMAITKSKLLIKTEIDAVAKQIKEGELTLLSLEMEKRGVLGMTAETFANQKFNDAVILNNYYKDKSLTEKVFKEGEFNLLDTSELDAYMERYNEIVIQFREEVLKKIAIQPFFQNVFGLCDNDIYKFFGKPIVQLTIYQINLFGLGSYYKDIIISHGGQITEQMIEDPDSFVEKVIQKKNIEKTLQSADGSTAQSIVGMTAEDRERAGITKGETIGLSRFVGKSFEEIAMEHQNM